MTDAELEQEIANLQRAKRDGKTRSADGTFAAEPLSIDAELRKLRKTHDEKQAVAVDAARFLAAKADPEVGDLPDETIKKLLKAHPGAYARPHALNVDAPRDWSTGSDMDFARSLRARFGV
jgi:hypothetical protein